MHLAVAWVSVYHIVLMAGPALVLGLFDHLTPPNGTRKSLEKIHKAFLIQNNSQ